MSKISCRNCIYCGEPFLAYNGITKDNSVPKELTYKQGNKYFYYKHNCRERNPFIEYYVDEVWECGWYKENTFLKLLRGKINLKEKYFGDDIINEVIVAEIRAIKNKKGGVK